MSCQKEVLLACNISFDSYKEIPHFGYKRTKIENENTVAFVVETEDYNVLVFRGTDQLKDWIENLMFVGSRTKRIHYKESDPYYTQLNAAVHAGFHKSFRRVKNQIDDVILKSPKKPWIITGHSLGGAIASVASLLLDLDNPMLITFGAPDWGNTDATWMVTQRTSHYLRFVNGNDIVCGIFRFVFTKPSPPIRLQSKNSRHPLKGHLEYREALGLPADW